MNYNNCCPNTTDCKICAWYAFFTFCCPLGCIPSWCFLYLYTDDNDLDEHIRYLYDDSYCCKYNCCITCAVNYLPTYTYLCMCPCKIYNTIC